jgi:glycosyltransferase involved in cell wall biosynthesis
LTSTNGVTEAKDNRGFSRMTSNSRVVVVCMLDSIHTARWLENFKDQDIDFYLFPSTPNRRVHSQIKNLISHAQSQTSSFRLSAVAKWAAIPMWGADLVFGNRIRGYLVARMARKIKATHVHAMELNHAGKISTKALKHLGDLRPKVISTVWGSDIYWFGRFAKHQGYLTEILKGTDLLISECARDFELAKDLGFDGKFAKSETLFGFSDSQIEKERVPASKRNLILIKGYESFVGRASIAIKAAQILSKDLDKYEIHVYSTTWKTRMLIEEYNSTADRKIIYYKKNTLTSSKMLELFERARVHIGISLSDGVPASMLESMVTGAFPIQTNTSCCDGWIVNQKSGLMVSPDLDEVVAALAKAINDDQLVDSAMAINHQTAMAKLSQSFVANRISGMNLYQ